MESKTIIATQQLTHGKQLVAPGDRLTCSPTDADYYIARRKAYLTRDLTAETPDAVPTPVPVRPVPAVERAPDPDPAPEPPLPPAADHVDGDDAADAALASSRTANPFTRRSAAATTTRRSSTSSSNQG